MAEIIITTDGTIAGTTLKVDGKDITKNNKQRSLSCNRFTLRTLFVLYRINISAIN